MSTPYRHVLAAAIVGNADSVVTFNLRDFPRAAVSSHEIEIIHPDDFLLAQYELNQVRVLTVVKALRERLKNPQKTAEELVATYAAQNLPQFAAKLTGAIHLI